jgi:ATP-binding cassette subfamily B protein
VLDEPTSAMDPRAEADWLSRFRPLSVRSHRSSHHAAVHDRDARGIVYVMANERIPESGDHEQLLERRGLYGDLWLEGGWDVNKSDKPERH